MIYDANENVYYQQNNCSLSSSAWCAHAGFWPPAVTNTLHFKEWKDVAFDSVY